LRSKFSFDKIRGKQFGKQSELEPTYINNETRQTTMTTPITSTQQQKDSGSDALSVSQFQRYQTKRKELRDEIGGKQVNIHII